MTAELTTEEYASLRDAFFAMCDLSPTEQRYRVGHVREEKVQAGLIDLLSSDWAVRVAEAVRFEEQPDGTGQPTLSDRSFSSRMIQLC